METLQLILFEYVLGYVLQGFMLALGIYAFTRQPIDKKKYIITGITLSIIIYVTRLLPIIPGIHTILALVCAFLLGILFLKTPIVPTIRAILIITILLLATEFINIFVMTSIFGQEHFNSMMNDNVQKALIGMPAQIVFAILIVISYFVFKKKKSDKNGENGA